MIVSDHSSLSPMADDRSHRTAAEYQPRGLGAALASINRREPRASVGMEEHMESDVGHHHDDDDRISVPDLRKSTTSKPKRSSLIDYSREFKEKFVQFVQEYDEEDGKIPGAYNDVDLEASNRFPTRGVDLRHVDQGTNLMDASSARHDWSEDAEVEDAEVEDDYYQDEEIFGEAYYDEEDDDVYANYTQGYSGTANPDYNDQGYIDDTSFRPAIAGCGGVKKALESEKRSMKTMHTERFSSFKKKASNRCDWGCCFGLLMVALATLLLASLGMFKSASDTISNAIAATPILPSSPVTTAPTPATPAAAFVSGNSAGDAERRRLVLDHVLKEELFKESHAAVLNPTHPSAQKAITWMTKYDSASMKLLDNFNYHPFHAMENKDTTLEKQDIDDPNNHAKQITEIYVEVVFWFESHPQEKPESAKIH